jgi:hypothetical protein
MTVAKRDQRGAAGTLPVVSGSLVALMCLGGRYPVPFRPAPQPALALKPARFKAMYILLACYTIAFLNLAA